MKVLVIPEDQELDRYIVKPVLEALFDEIGQRARVDVLPEPRLRGASDALDPKMVAQIIAENPMTDLFLLVVDRDCDRQGNVAKAQARQNEHKGKLLACVAVEEVEVWMLALYKDDLGDSFSAVRRECDPKEKYADTLLEDLELSGPGRGRKAAMRALAGKWTSLRDSCPELRDLRDAIVSWRAARS
ncbi:MAG: hypothetical protein JNL21_33700 [Myxococcales bacterium]|nr:hypothetical protein [Myxococcales bacterium]